jgi:hypothetical protein
MKLFRYQNFINESKEDIHSICRKYDIKNYTINGDGTIDVDGDVVMSEYKLTKLPIKFGKVSGNFYCSDNKLTSLSGAPLEVGGGFSCSRNQLTSLEGSPSEVGGDFYCSFNQLTSLEGAPREVGGNFYCYNNQLISLSGSPREVGGSFNCSYNELRSLSGISKYISKGIDIEINHLRDVKGVKDGWRGRFLVKGNPVAEIFKLFPSNRWDEVIEYLNEYDVIRDGKVVILQALELVFYEMGLEVPEIDQIEGYEIQF